LRPARARSAHQQCRQVALHVRGAHARAARRAARDRSRVGTGAAALAEPSGALRPRAGSQGRDADDAPRREGDARRGDRGRQHGDRPRGPLAPRGRGPRAGGSLSRTARHGRDAPTRPRRDDRRDRLPDARGAGGGRRARDRGHRGRRDRRPDPETLRRGARARRRSRDRTPRRRRRRLAEPRLRRRGRRPGRRGRARPSQGRPAPRDVPRRADADDSGARERVLPARRRDRCRGPDPARTPDGARPAGDGSTGRPARSSGSALSRALLNEMDQLPYVDLPRQHAVLKTELLQAIGRVLDHAQFVLGEEVAEFERRFAALCTVTYAIGVNSGTDALVLALSALDVGPGDEVITVPNSFVATTSAIRLLGARPVFVDVRDDLNIDPDRLEAAIGPATKAILPVHLTGRPCDMAAILAVAERRGVAVVEDCAQAVGAEYAGRRVGSFGRLGCFSLHPLKNLNACGDGGVVTTDDAELAGRVRNLRDLGRIGRDDCGTWAGNSRLDTMQAAILLVKLEHLDRWTVR